MRINTYLKVIEICLYYCTENKRVCKLRPKEIRKKLIELSYNSKDKLQSDEIKKILKEVFPIFKNRRRGTKIFKINQKIAEDFLYDKRLFLRPNEHIKWAINDRIKIYEQT